MEKVIKSMNPERDAEIVRRYMAGETQLSIAAAVGLGRAGVCNIIKRRGVCGKRVPRDSAAEARGKRIAPLFLMGRSIESIASCEGVAKSQIYEALKAAGVEIPPKHQERNAQIVKMHREGMPVRHISSFFKLTRQVVNKVLRQNGVASEGKARVPARSLSDQEARQILNLYQSGAKAGEIEAQYDVDLFLLRQRYGEQAIRNRRVLKCDLLPDSKCSVDHGFEALGS